MRLVEIYGTTKENQPTKIRLMGVVLSVVVKKTGQVFLWTMQKTCVTGLCNDCLGAGTDEQQFHFTEHIFM